jgi:phage tail sheath gpL-like
MSFGAPGVPSSNKYPGVFQKLIFGASAATAGNRPRFVLVFANKTSSGTGTTNTTVYTPQSADEAKTLAGQGSEAHLMAQAFFGATPGALMKLILVTEAGGAKASQTITVTGTAVGSGDYELYIHGVRVTFSVYDGDTQNTIATAIGDAIGGKADSLCVTKSVASNIVTVTYRHNGPRGNIVKLRLVAPTTVSGTSIALGGSTLAGGAATADDVTTALTTAASTKYHYYCTAQIDSTNLGLIKTQLGTMIGPLVNKRQVSVHANVDTFGNATTLVQTLNEPLMQILWHPDSEDLPGIVAATWASRRSVAEGTDISTNLSIWNPSVVDLNGFVFKNANESNYMSQTTAAAALNVGLTPIQVRPTDGHPMVVRSITTRSLDSLGNPDTRVLDTVNVTVPIALADEIEAAVYSEFENSKLRDDEEDGDDTLPPNTTTPKHMKSFVFDVCKNQFEANGHIRNLNADYEKWDFSLDPNGAPGRLNATWHITPAQWLVQFSSELNQL